MIFPDKQLPLEVAKAVSMHDRGAITISTLSCNDRWAEKGKCLHVLTSPHLHILSAQTMSDGNQTTVYFLSGVVEVHKVICFEETQFRCERRLSIHPYPGSGRRGHIWPWYAVAFNLLSWRKFDCDFAVLKTIQSPKSFSADGAIQIKGTKTIWPVYKFTVCKLISLSCLY